MSDLDDLRTEHDAIFGDAACPHWAQESINHYVDQGVPTGDFLQAVLSNDLIGAAGRADLDSGRALAAIAGYVYRHVPSVAHGSTARVHAWIKRHQERRAAEGAAK